MEKTRSSFSGGIGFVLAAAGSAVGLGNLWRFPYLAAQYGGGIFIFVYIILALTFGFAMLTTEIAIGRKTGKSPILAYTILNKNFGILGVIATLVPVIILPYYSVIGGWVIKYVSVYVTGAATAAASDSYFGGFIGSPVAPLVYFIIFLGLTLLIVVCGVEKGIEKVSRILMPILFLLTIIVSIYVLLQPGAMEGVKYYLLPDFSKFSFKTVCGAMGQLFYSMSIAMGIMITYGSYTSKDVSLSKSVNQIEIFDTLVAFLAGFMVIPTIYMFSGEAGLTASGPGLMFVSLPKIFDQMVGGRAIGLIFFVLVLFAALTSSVSIMEAIVSSFMDRFKMNRISACILTFVISVLLGVPSSLGNGAWADIKILGMDFLTFFDYLSNSVMMPIVGFLTCILIGWIVTPKVIVDEITRNGEKFARKGIYVVMIKYVAPVLLLLILIVYSLAQFGFLSI